METKTIAVDFGKVDIYHRVEAGLAGLEVGVLGRCYDDVIGQLPLSESRGFGIGGVYVAVVIAIYMKTGSVMTSALHRFLFFVFLTFFVFVLLRCCDRLTVLELFVLLAEVWRCTARRAAASPFPSSCLPHRGRK